MAGAGRRVFQPGEILTASNVMSYLQDQAVMVFDDATERDVALGTAVVSEGMVSYLGNTNALSFYDGSSWRTLGSVSGLPVVAGGTGGTSVAEAQDNLGVGLVLVTPPTVNFSGGTATLNSLNEVAFTGVTSVSLNGVFSSGYTNYRILTRITIAAGSPELRYRLRASGSDNSSGVYQWHGAYGYSTGAPLLTFTAGTNQTSGRFGIVTPTWGGGTVDIFSPNANTRTISTSQFASLENDGSIMYSQTTGNAHNANNVFDGITLFPTTSSITGTIQVFGYNA